MPQLQFFLVEATNAQSSATHTRTEQMALLCRFWGCLIIFDLIKHNIHSQVDIAQKVKVYSYCLFVFCWHMLVREQ